MTADHSPARPPRPVALAGTVLAIMGAVESTLGLLFLVYAVLFIDTSSLPEWVELGAVPRTASLQFLLLAVLVLLIAGAQVWVGLALHRSASFGTRLAGIALAAGGAGITVVAMLPRGGGGTANLAFLPLTVAYLSVVAALGWLGRRRLD